MGSDFRVSQYLVGVNVVGGRCLVIDLVPETCTAIRGCNMPTSLLPVFCVLGSVVVQAYPEFLVDVIHGNTQVSALPSEEEQTVDVKRSLSSSIWAAFVMIMATELGDKSFIVATVLAGKKPRLAIFLGSVLTMTIMCIISSAIGITFMTLIDPFYLKIAVSCLFLVFCILCFKEACSEENPCDETEVENEILREENGQGREEIEIRRRNTWLHAMWQCMGLVFCAEWGDKSQLGTVTLVSQCDALGVVFGAVIGVVVCASIAVMAGRWIASHLSEKTMGVLAGFIFLGFAVLNIVLA